MSSSTWTASEQKSLPGMLARQVERRGEHIALQFGAERITYQQIHERSTSAAHALSDLGVEEGGVVAGLTENCPDQVYLLFAVSMLGAAEVMINSSYRGEFLAHQLRDSGATVVIVDAALVPALAAVSASLPHLVHVLVRGEVEDDAVLQTLGTAVSVHPADVLYRPEPEPILDTERFWNVPSSIVYTSGTTGPSKGAVLTQNYLVELAFQESGMWCVDDESAFFSCTPIFHLAAKGVAILGALSRGVRCVVDDHFSVSGFWARIREERCTATILLGSMVPLLAAREPDDDEGIDVVVALPVAAELQGPLEERWGCRFETVYGLSEAAPVVKSDVTERLHPGSAGKVNRDFFDVLVFDDDDQPLAPGEVGEIVVRSRRPHVMFEGYLNNPAATMAQFRNGWFHTGDLGRFDGDGYLYFVDRKKDYLRRGGENISSFEIESALRSHQQVLDAAVVGVASELSEDEVKAVVVLVGGAELRHEELIEFCIDAMPYFAVPRYLQLVTDLPRTPSGKVEKYKLRAEGVGPLVWDREAAGIVLGRRGRVAR
ncbi:ATP-dependent acyl-CoA ligase [Nocardioides hungaricus]